MAVAVMAAATAIGAVGERQSQPEALPLQGVADGLVMSHQPAAPPYTDVGEYTTGSGARRGLLDPPPTYWWKAAARPLHASSNLASTPTPDLEPWYVDGGNGSVAQQQSRTEYVQVGGVNPPRALPPDDPIHQLGTTITIEPTPSPVQAAMVRAAAVGGSLTEAEVIAVLREVGAPEEWIPPLLTIAFCESRWSPGAVGDGGNSLGMFQLWYGWARPMGYTPDDLFDPVKAARTAIYVREVRGRFGGGGGWTCADLSGVH